VGCGGDSGWPLPWVIFRGCGHEPGVLVAVLYLPRGVRNALLARFRTDFGVTTVAFSEAGSGTSDMTETLEPTAVQIRSLSAEIEDVRSRYTVQLRIPPRRGGQGVLEEIPALPSVERVSMAGLGEVE
jgi:hypothetical protein